MGRKSSFTHGMGQRILRIRMAPLDILWKEEVLINCSFNWSTKYKWFLTITVCFISILTGLPAGSYGAGNEWMAPLFNVQNEPFPNLYWATCSWNMGAALFPLVFVPLTENTGRMSGYFVSNVIKPSGMQSLTAYRSHTSSSSYSSSDQLLPTTLQL